MKLPTCCLYLEIFIVKTTILQKKVFHSWSFFFFFFLNKVTERHFDHFNRSIKNTQKVKMRKFFRESSSSNPKTIQILKTRKQTNHLAYASWVLPDGCVRDWRTKVKGLLFSKCRQSTLFLFFFSFFFLLSFFLFFFFFIFIQPKNFETI